MTFYIHRNMAFQRGERTAGSVSGCTHSHTRLWVGVEDGHVSPRGSWNQWFLSSTLFSTLSFVFFQNHGLWCPPLLVKLPVPEQFQTQVILSFRVEGGSTPFFPSVRLYGRLSLSTWCIDYALCMFWMWSDELVLQCLLKELVEGPVYV